MKYKIGVISDTHGLLRPHVLTHFQGMDLIIHAGDIGSPEILTKLKTITNTTAVLGNMDVPYYYPGITTTKSLEILEKKIYVIHNIDMLNIDPTELGIDLIIFGHSHRPTLQKKSNVLYFNPGSAGPQRFKLPITLGMINITENKITGKHIRIKPQS
ncbi:MAG: metallophosphoesterase family protein [Firmicutes bacterium]|nr:metallophosphoesterase family protein [Bacillota bacterium]